MIEQHGLSAAIYTQTTDVEVEVNGLMTYDRVLKMPIETVAKANRFQFPPEPKQVVLSPTASQHVGVTWRYTTDKPAEGWTNAEFDAGSWKEGEAGFGTAGTPGSIIGTEWKTSDIWLRREFEVKDKPSRCARADVPRRRCGSLSQRRSRHESGAPHRRLSGIRGQQRGCEFLACRQECNRHSLPPDDGRPIHRCRTHRVGAGEVGALARWRATRRRNGELSLREGNVSRRVRRWRRKLANACRARRVPSA